MSLWAQKASRWIHLLLFLSSLYKTFGLGPDPVPTVVNGKTLVDCNGFWIRHLGQTFLIHELEAPRIIL